MHFLTVFYDGEVDPVARVVVHDPSGVLAAVNDLKAAFPEYQRIEVQSGDKRLFSVDVNGKIHPV